MDQAPDTRLNQVRLTPDMASFRLLVFAFVREYIDRYRIGPSQGEIGNALGAERTRVRRALRSLAQDGLILRGKGERGLSLPSVRDEALRQLRQLGWNECDGILTAPGTAPVSPLLEEVEIDYP